MKYGICLRGELPLRHGSCKKGAKRAAAPNEKEKRPRQAPRSCLPCNYGIYGGIYGSMERPKGSGMEFSNLE